MYQVCFFRRGVGSTMTFDSAQAAKQWLAASGYDGLILEVEGAIEALEDIRDECEKAINANGGYQDCVQLVHHFALQILDPETAQLVENWNNG